MLCEVLCELLCEVLVDVFDVPDVTVTVVFAGHSLVNGLSMLKTNRTPLITQVISLMIPTAGMLEAGPK